MGEGAAGWGRGGEGWGRGWDGEGRGRGRYSGAGQGRAKFVSTRRAGCLWRLVLGLKDSDEV